MRGEEVRRLNSMLNEYFSFSKERPPMTVRDYYGTDTEERVSYLGGLWGMKNKGAADRAFMRRLSREIRGKRLYQKVLAGE